MEQSIKTGIESVKSKVVARTPMDATTVLSIFVALMLGIRSDLAVAGLGGAGAPSALLGLGMLLWWIWHRIHVGRPIHETRPWPPVRVAMFLFLASVLVSFVVASISPLPFLESSGADKSLIQVGAFAGILLVAHDGIPTRERFLVLVRRIALFGGLYASLGLLQFFTNRSWVAGMSIPGLHPSGFGGIDLRSGFVRPSATGIHSVEYAMVLTMILPLALTLAMRDTSRGLFARWFPALAVIAACALSVSRSALIGLAVVMLVLVFSWRPRERWAMFGAMCGGLLVMLVAVPGMAGTLAGMFDGQDSSIVSRTDSYGLAGSFIQGSPFFGRGLGTFLPEYRILDNQYLRLLIEIGIVGTAAFLLVMLCAMGTVLHARRATSPGLHRDLSAAMFAMVLGGTVVTAFFDAFSFPQACGLLLLSAGLAGAYGTLSNAPHISSGALDSEPKRLHPMSLALHKNWFVAIVAIALVLGLAPRITAVQGLYWMKFDVVFLLPPGASDHNALRNSASNIVPYTAMIERQYESRHPVVHLETNGAPLYGSGLDVGLAASLPNSGGQWQTNFNRPAISLEIIGTTSEQVMDQAQQAIQSIRELADESQDEMGVVRRSFITTQVNPEQPSVQYIDVRTRRAYMGLGLLALGAGIASAVLAQGLRNYIARARRAAPALLEKVRK